MISIYNLIDILFPRCCPVCGDIVEPRGSLICPGCVRKLSFVRLPVCKKCGKELDSDVAEYCFDCTRHHRSFESGMALLNYDDVSRASMVRIKYKNKREYLEFYGEAVVMKYGNLIQRLKAQALIPVPVHPSRKRSRGFNQAECLADKIGEGLGIPVRNDILIRCRKTEPQKELGPAQRLSNLEQAFAVNGCVKDVETVILVDDIYTTGSTVEACTRALLKAGVKRVYVVVICIGRRE